MQYLYHGVPKDLIGSTLYPLNQLKNNHPNLYEVKTAKYEGRRGVMERRIPTLDCLWNDVLHLTAVHPEALMEALINSGRPVGEKMRFFKIDPSILDPDLTTVYLYSDREKNVQVPESDFVPFKIEDLPKYAKISDRTTEYFKERYESGNRPLLFHGVPHILYKGTIDVANLSVIEV